MLSESVYGRAWRAARQAVLGPGWPPQRWLAARMTCGTPPSRWLNAAGAPAEVAARVGNSARVLQTYTCTAPTATTTSSASGSKTPSPRTQPSHARHSS